MSALALGKLTYISPISVHLWQSDKRGSQLGHMQHHSSFLFVYDTVRGVCDG